MSSPPSSAAVLEHLCLFTHDLRRKQKRWQDGRLKFHTFNRRVMVYDERGNFVGDMHWRADYDFDEGEEFQLERGAVLVQVSECIGRQDQDLSELLDKRAREKEQRQAAAASRASSLAPPRPPPRAPPSGHSQLRHRPLHQLIGTPSGHHGRAVVPAESPYEERHGGSSPAEEEGRSSKRRRCRSPPPSRKGYAQNLFGQALTLSATPLSSAPAWTPSAHERSPSVDGDGPAASRRTHPAVNERPVSVGRPSGNSSSHTRIRNGATGETDGASNMLGLGITSLRRPTGLGRAPQASSATTLVPRPWNDEDAAGDVDDADVIEVPDPSLHTLRGVATRTGPQAARTRPANVASKGKHGSKGDVNGVEMTRAEAGCRAGGDSRECVTARPRMTTSSPERQDAASAQKQAPDSMGLGIPGETDRLALGEEPKVELRIKPRQRRGLLMMSERTAAPAPALQRAHGPDTGPSDPGTRCPRARATTQADSAHDDPFASSPTNGGSARPLPSIAYCEPSGPSSPENHSVPLRERPPNIPRRDNRSSGEQARRPLRDENAPPNVGGCPRPRASPKMVERPASPAGVLSFDRQAGDGPSTRPSSGESWSAGEGFRVLEDAASGDGEEASSINTGREKEDPSEADPDVSMPVTRRSLRRKASRVADWELTSDDGGGGSTEAQGPGELETTPPRVSKRARTGEVPNVPAGPRLARLSRRGVKSREVIGLTIDPASLLRNLGIQCLPFGNQPLIQPPKSNPSTTRENLTGRDQDQARREGCVETAARPEPALEAERANKASTETERQAPLRRRPEPTVVSREAPFEPTGGPSNAACDAGAAATRSTAAPAPARSAAIPPAAERPRSINGLSRQNSLVPSDADRGPEKPGPEPPGAAAHEPRAAAPPRLVNPATRGRKAALKSDAAGQVPQHVLPPNPVAAPAPAPACPPPPPGGPLGGAGVRPDEAEATAGPPAIKMRFPGFVTAKDSGPWSREAYDLLETGRPG